MIKTKFGNYKEITELHAKTSRKIEVSFRLLQCNAVSPKEMYDSKL